MPGIKSPIGSSKFTSTQQPPSFRTYEVPDETEYENVQEYGEQFSRERNAIPAPPMQSADGAELRAQRHAMAAGQSPLSSEARERIKLLTGLGRGTKDVKVNNVTFTLRTLKAKETQEGLFAAANVPMINSEYEGYKYVLAKSITHIDGTDFGVVIGSHELKDKLNFIENLEDSVFNHLRNQYNLLTNETTGKFAFKTEEDINKTVDEIKK